ncbi:MAG: hypothetical protein JOZ15_04565, partial [Acidobacteria bacterium]|nr:hypothetical protein [Acidobacteriota bacterium]
MDPDRQAGAPRAAAARTRGLRGSAWKRLALVAAGLLAAELAAQLGLAVQGEGRAAVAAAQESILRSAARDRTSASGEAAGGAPSRPPAAGAAGVRAEAANTRVVLQPYLGYVVDPEINEWPGRAASGAPMITGDGFFDLHGPP